MDGNFCPACYGTSMTYEHGVLVCDDCGAQTQKVQEETEFQQGIDDARGRRRAAGSGAASQQPSQAALISQQEQSAEQQLQDAAMLYARCLQALLQAQGEALHERFGVSPQISSLLRQLWLSVLPSTGLLEPAPHRLPVAGPCYVWLGRGSRQPATEATAAAGAAAPGHGEDGSGSDEDMAEAAQQGGDEDDEEAQGQQQQNSGHRTMRAAEVMQPQHLKRLLWKLLHPQVTLQLCFLGCLLLREAVTHADITCWALDNQLPFLDLPHISRQLAGDDLAQLLPVRVLQPQLSLSPAAFCAGCLSVADHLGLDLPPVVGEALLLRSVRELGLPLAVYETALQLLFLHLLDSPCLRVSAAATQPLPYVWLAALLLVAIKLLYGLGGAAGQLPLVAKAPGPPGGWQAWAATALGCLPGASSMALTQQEVLQLGPAAVRRYIAFCRQHVFAGQPVVPDMDDTQRLLAGWYDAAADADADAAATTGTTPAAAAAAAATVGAADRPPSVAAGAGGAAEVPDAARPGEALACNYGLTMGQKNAPGLSRLEPDLAAVVVVLAAHSQAGPGVLLGCVRKLEKQMLVVESAVRVMHRLQREGWQEQQQQQQQEEQQEELDEQQEERQLEARES